LVTILQNCVSTEWLALGLCRIGTFQKKADACNVSIVFNVTGMEHMYKGAGYHHPKSYTEPPQGLDSFPAIFSYPTVSSTTFLNVFVLILSMYVIIILF